MQQCDAVRVLYWVKPLPSAVWPYAHTHKVQIKRTAPSTTGGTEWTCAPTLEHASTRACKCDRVCVMAQSPEDNLYLVQTLLRPADINRKSALDDGSSPQTWRIDRGSWLNICTIKLSMVCPISISTGANKGTSWSCSSVRSSPLFVGETAVLDCKVWAAVAFSYCHQPVGPFKEISTLCLTKWPALHCPQIWVTFLLIPPPPLFFCICYAEFYFNRLVNWGVRV